MANGDQNNKNATIHEVARLAECSIATVSCVLNNRGRISEATQKRVRDACKQLRYFPNAAGRNLRSRKTECIGILFYPSCAAIFRDIFYEEIVEGLEEILTQANYNLLLAGYDLSTHHDDLPKFMREGSVDGVIMMGGCPDDFRQRLIDTPLPFLLLDTDMPGVAVDSVTTDAHGAMAEVVSYLYDAGHRRMLMLRHPGDNYNENARCMGFEAEARRRGIEDGVDVLPIETNDEAVEEIVSRLAASDPITAVATVNDDMAANIVSLLAARGIRVPDDVSITGFDDTDFAKHCKPPLTTVALDRKMIGIEGAKTILRRIGHPSLPHRKIIIPSRLVERASVKSI